MAYMTYFIKWWDSDDPYDKKGQFVTKGFRTRKDCLKFIMRYMFPNETVTFYSDPKCTRIYGKVKESNGQFLYLADNLNNHNRKYVVQKDGTVKTVML